MSDAADKLAQTRLAIVAQIQRGDRKARKAERDEARELTHPGSADTSWEDEELGSGPAAWYAHVKRIATAWWRQHPAHLGLELATPALAAYARRKPAQFLGIAAAVGAVAVIARPWRLISLTGLVVALMKSSQLSGLLMSAMSAADFERDQQRPER